MQRSSELEQSTLELVEAMAKGDIQNWNRWISQHADSLGIGTDPREWWEGRSTVQQAFETQLAEMGQMQFEVERLKAYTHGDSGWSAIQGLWKLADGTQVSIRQSFVFVREDGGWRWVHMHASVGVGNQEAIGRELTV